MSNFLIFLFSSACLIFHLENCNATRTHIEVNGTSGLTISSIHGKRRFALDQIIGGTQLNCRATRLFVWGRPKKISSKAPQVGYLSLFDATKLRVISSRTLGSGVRGIYFSSNGRLAMVETNYTMLIDLKDGSMHDVEKMVDQMHFTQEQCIGQGPHWVQ